MGGYAVKMLKYKVVGYTSVYNAATDKVEQKECFYTVEKAYSEANEEIAKREAYNGEYTIEDDEQPDPDVASTN